MPDFDLEPISFAVDAALLRELGERLVGRPHIALAELVKNAYDADATHVEIDVGTDRLRVADDGHGMSAADFRNRWMRVGTPHKEQEVVSPRLGRTLTGSKGIGRLSAQFLGQDLQLWTQADSTRAPQTYAQVDWKAAREKDLMTEATALTGVVPKKQQVTFANGALHGTVIEIGSLNQAWTPNELQGLAQEVWVLQPPFSAQKNGFEIALSAADPEAEQSFESQALAYLDAWYARIKGEVNREGVEAGTLDAELEFFDGDRHRLKMKLDPLRVHHASFEIRVYYLKYRQSHNLSVGDMREYFNRWGGVHVYDSGFRLPYYGPDQDWLNIEMDFSHRLARSALLPVEEQVRNGLQYLPSNSRLFGEIRVSTNDEYHHEGSRANPQDVLQIQASRDRLVDNRAFDDLRKAVRTTIDWYANREAARVYHQKDQQAETEPVSVASERLEDVVESLEPKLDPEDYGALASAVETLRTAEGTEATQRERQTRLMATLASAGAASLAYEHEIGKQLRQLERIASKLKRLGRDDDDVGSLASTLTDWLDRAKSARALFSPLLEEESREVVRALPARPAIEQIARDTEFLLAGVPVEVEVDPELRLPKARLAEWAAIFQNAFTNAVEASKETSDPRIRITGGTAGRSRFISIEDNGVGIDLERAEHLFEPFERGEPDRVGTGTGLGLAIVRMLANAIGVKTAFVEPSRDGDMSTSLRISWRPAG